MDTYHVDYTVRGRVMVQARSQAEAEDLVRRGFKGWEGDAETMPNFELNVTDTVRIGTPDLQRDVREYLEHRRDDLP